ncbi:MAG: ATP phosphoribosyltransferase, partial [Desulfovibrio sp.]|nr:ATP phosphoribosyltransferase [Desulfovibrio sp.]
MQQKPLLKLGIPKGSLEEATINLFERAGWKIRRHARNYFPEINDPEISVSICRVQEIGGYIQDGIMDLGIAGQDWLVERGFTNNVLELSKLVYSKVSTRPCRWVLAVANSQPYQKPEDLAGKRIATELI